MWARPRCRGWRPSRSWTSRSASPISPTSHATFPCCSPRAWCCAAGMTGTGISVHQRIGHATCTCMSAPQAVSGSTTTCCPRLPASSPGGMPALRRSQAGQRSPLGRRRLGLHRGQDRSHPRHPRTGQGVGNGHRLGDTVNILACEAAHYRVTSQVADARPDQPDRRGPSARAGSSAPPHAAARPARAIRHRAHRR